MKGLGGQQGEESEEKVHRRTSRGHGDFLPAGKGARVQLGEPSEEVEDHASHPDMEGPGGQGVAQFVEHQGRQGGQGDQSHGPPPGGGRVQDHQEQEKENGREGPVDADGRPQDPNRQGEVHGGTSLSWTRSG